MSGVAKFWQGNEACTYGAIAAGARFFGGYPITPSSEVAEMCSRLLPKIGGVYMQMEDEIASIASVIGASLSGKKAFTATSGPGFSLMQENLGVAVYQEVPCVIINVQRVGPSMGLATKPAQGDVMQARWGTHGDHSIIALSPSSVQECFDLTIEAFNLAEQFRTPVILLSDEIIGHLREKVIVPPMGDIKVINRKPPAGLAERFLPFDPGADGVPPMAAYGDQYIFRSTTSCHDETGFTNNTPQVAEQLVRRLCGKIEDNRKDIIKTRAFGSAEAGIGIVAFGAVVRSAKEAIVRARQEGIEAQLLQLITLWPFPKDEVHAFCNQKKGVIIPEMNMGQVFGEVERFNRSGAPLWGLNQVNGESIVPGQILEKIREVSKCLRK